MLKSENFTMRISQQDRMVFEELARRLNRNQSEVLRLIAREVLIALKAEETGAQNDSIPTSNGSQLHHAYRG